MKTTAMKVTLVGWMACFAFGVLADSPEIRDVMIRQRWPWSRLWISTMC
ncbi:MAG TPA: hypothetical protein P5026_13895 [Kiritimatiellia bacterium]|nr:hypothetical protein [Kiritimatiellia bacterium]HRU71725.1 hypothetical protein [Kiritimatiellia bacterium]